MSIGAGITQLLCPASNCRCPDLIIMKKIEAIIQPFKLDEVKDALAAIGVDGMTVSEVRGFERGRRGTSEIWMNDRFGADCVPLIKIEVVVRDSMVDRAMDIVVTTAKTGHIGDGKLFVVPVDEAIRIRTGELGKGAV